MACTKKIQIEDTIYEANTDFRIAIKCNEIATNETIGDFERALGIICTIFGASGLDNPNHYEKLLKWSKKWLSCGKEIVDTYEQPDMDYVEDYDYIWTSMYSDYNGLDIDKEEIDWHRFNKLMNGLSNSEFGNCCVLNRVRNLRNYDISQIKDAKERQKMAKAKESVALKKYKKENNLTKEQEESMARLNEILGL
ncbi:MAG: hypothetical protein IJ690_02085 [Clostridia bacterium]|nr:hypothetical protein [Clostridia bacterium]MBR1653731.1 hypothetical protein [Clostridia bacterium]